MRSGGRSMMVERRRVRGPALAFPTTGGGGHVGLPGCLNLGGIGNTGTIAASTLHYMPFYVEPGRGVIITDIYAKVSVKSSTGGATSRWGIYTATNALQPDKLKVDAGTMAVDATATPSLSVSAFLSPGWHLLAMHSDAGNQPQYSTNRYGWSGATMGITNWQCDGMWSVGKTYGALADPGTAWSSVLTSTSPFIAYGLLKWTPR